MVQSRRPKLPRVKNTSAVFGTQGKAGVFFWPRRDYGEYRISTVLVQEGKLPDQDRVVEVLLEREKLGSTGIGDGIAIPHGKMGGIKELVASFGRSITGVNFESVDNKPTHLFFLLVAPENSAGVHLKALARISRLLKDPSFRNRLMEAGDRQDLFRTIIEADEKF
jgi:PTS system nitrogen regulatory IIA component